LDGLWLRPLRAGRAVSVGGDKRGLHVAVCPSRERQVGGGHAAVGGDWFALVAGGAGGLGVLTGGRGCAPIAERQAGGGHVADGGDQFGGVEGGGEKQRANLAWK
jgi:hypothetical protein